MARIRYNHSTFASGVIDKKSQGNTEFEGYNNGLDECVNFYVGEAGGCFKRSGTHFVASTKYNSDAKLVPFYHTGSSPYVLEFGEHYIRVFNIKGEIVAELTTEFSLETVNKLKYLQYNIDLFILTDQGIFILSKDTDGFKLTKRPIPFTFMPLTFFNKDISLRLDEVCDDIKKEIVFSARARGTDNEPDRQFAPLFYISDVDITTPHYLVLIYKNSDDTNKWFFLKILDIIDEVNGFKKIKCIIDQDLSYKSIDDKGNVVNELLPNERIDQWFISAFSTDRGFPNAMALYESRLFLANNKSYPCGIWGSSLRYDDFFNFILGDDEDTIHAKANLEFADNILWLASQSKLFIGTSRGLYIAGAASYNDEAITTNNFRVRMIDAIGAGNIQPIVALDRVFFVDNVYDNVYEIALSPETGSYRANNLSVLSANLTKSGIIAHTWQQNPVQIYWCVVKDGHLCSFTYERSNGIRAWCKHVLGGTASKVIDVVSLEDGADSYLWMIVSREINGKSVKYIEYLHQSIDSLQEEGYKGFYLDSGIKKEKKYIISDIKLSKPHRIICNMSHKDALNDLEKWTILFNKSIPVNSDMIINYVPYIGKNITNYGFDIEQSYKDKLWETISIKNFTAGLNNQLDADMYIKVSKVRNFEAGDNTVLHCDDVSHLKQGDEIAIYNSGILCEQTEDDILKTWVDCNECTVQIDKVLPKKEGEYTNLHDVVNTGSDIVAVGTNGKVLFISDSQNSIDNEECSNLNSISYKKKDDNIEYVAVGDKGSYYTWSKNIQKMKKRTLNILNNLQKVITVGDKYIAVGKRGVIVDINDDVNLDNVTYITSLSQNKYNFKKIVRNDSIFVAIDENHKLLFCDNVLYFLPCNVEGCFFDIIYNAPSLTDIKEYKYSNLFIAVGQKSEQEDVAIIATSKDGVIWELDIKDNVVGLHHINKSLLKDVLLNPEDYVNHHGGPYNLEKIFLFGKNQVLSLNHRGDNWEESSLGEPDIEVCKIICHPTIYKDNMDTSICYVAITNKNKLFFTSNHISYWYSYGLRYRLRDIIGYDSNKSDDDSVNSYNFIGVGDDNRLITQIEYNFRRGGRERYISIEKIIKPKEKIIKPEENDYLIHITYYSYKNISYFLIYSHLWKIIQLYLEDLEKILANDNSGDFKSGCRTLFNISIPFQKGLSFRSFSVITGTEYKIKYNEIILISSDKVIWFPENPDLLLNYKTKPDLLQLGDTNFKSEDDGVTWSILGVPGANIKISMKSVILHNPPGIGMYHPTCCYTNKALNDISCANFGNTCQFMIAGDDNYVLTKEVSFEPEHDGNWQDVFKEPAALNDVIYQDSLWVAVGDNQILVTQDTKIFYSKFFENIVFRKICYGQGRFVTVGDSGCLYSSMDAQTWVRGNVQDYTSFNKDLYDVIFANDIFVAIGDGVILKSADGHTWQLQNSNITLKNIVYKDSNIYLGVGENSFYMLTENSAPVLINTNIKEDLKFIDILFINGKFYLLTEHKIFISIDGHILSHLYTVSDDMTIIKMVFDRDKFFLFNKRNNGKVTIPYVSNDAINWVYLDHSYIPAWLTDVIASYDDLIGCFSLGLVKFDRTEFFRKSKTWYISKETNLNSVVCGKKSGGSKFNIFIMSVGSNIIVFNDTENTLVYETNLISREVFIKYKSKIKYSEGVAFFLSSINGTDSLVISFDNKTWYSRNLLVPLYDVAYGNNIFVGVGYMNSIFISEDKGITWNYIGESKSNFATSKDKDVIRESIQIPTRRVEYLNKMFIAGDGYSIKVSYDGKNWSFNYSIRFVLGSSIAYGNGQFLMRAKGKGEGQEDEKEGLWKSTDGLTWENINSNFDGEDLLFTDYKFICVKSGLLYSSISGLSWGNESIKFPKIVSKDISSIAFGNKTLAIPCITYYYANSCRYASIEILYTKNSITWKSEKLLPFEVTEEAVEEEFKIYFANDCFYIPFSIRDSKRILSAATIIFNPKTEEFSYDFYDGITLQKIIYEDEKFVIMAKNSIITSDDGVSWLLRFHDYYINFRDIIYNGDVFIAVGVEHKTQVVCISQDTISWKKVNIAPSLIKIIYANEEFIGISENKIYKSANGEIWEEIERFIPQIDALWHLNNKYISLGHKIQNDQEVKSICLMASDDGFAWKQVSIPEISDVIDISFSDNKYWALGSKDNSNLLLVSMDGEVWTQENLFEQDELNNLACHGNQMMVVGTNNTVLTSDNGKNWYKPQQIDCDFNYIIFANNLYVLVGDKGFIVTGPNLERCSYRSSNTKANLYCAAYGNGRFVVVGDRGTVLVSVDGEIWKINEIGPLYNFRYIAYYNGFFIATGTLGSVNIIVTSIDGINWKENTNRDANSIGAIKAISFVSSKSYNDNKIVAVGDDEYVSILNTNTGRTFKVGNITKNNDNSGTVQILTSDLKPVSSKSSNLNNGASVFLKYPVQNNIQLNMGNNTEITVKGQLPSNYNDKVYIDGLRSTVELNNHKYFCRYKEYNSTNNTTTLYLYEPDLISDYIPVPLDSSFFSLYEKSDINGYVYLYFNSIDGLEHLINENVVVCIDGDYVFESVVPAIGNNKGVITLPKPAFSCSVGLKIKSWIKTVPFSGGSIMGSSVGCVGSHKEIILSVYNSLGGKYGSEKNNLYPITIKSYKDDYKLQQSYTGLIKLPMVNGKDIYNRCVYIEHDDPFGFNVLSIVEDIQVSDA